MSDAADIAGASVPGQYVYIDGRCRAAPQRAQRQGRRRHGGWVAGGRGLWAERLGWIGALALTIWVAL